MDVREDCKNLELENRHREGLLRQSLVERNYGGKGLGYSVQEYGL